MREFDIVIIGGGPALRSCVKALRWVDKNATIACIRQDKAMVNHCAMPYVLDKSTSLEKVIVPDRMITSKGAELFVEQAQKIERDKKIVKTSGGDFKYQKLFLMTGSAPIKPAWEGVGLENIFTLRRKEDIEKLEQVLNKEEAKNIVIVGGGYIGVEFASLLAKRGGLNISLVEALPAVMSASFDDEFCQKAGEILKEGGIRLYLSQKVTAFEGKDKVESVVLDSGKKLQAEVVILAVGVRPEIELALGCGLAADKDGVVVDEYLRTQDENIYAAGDVIRAFSAVDKEATGGRLGSNAVVEAKLAALNSAGFGRKFLGVANPSGTKIFNLAFGSCGLSERYLKEKGKEYIVGSAVTTSIYSMLPHSLPVQAKMIFAKDSLRLLGAQICGGDNIAGYVDLAAWFLLGKNTLKDILNIQFTTQPELSPQPRANVWASCAEDAWLKVKN